METYNWLWGMGLLVLAGCQDPPTTMRPFKGFPDGTQFVEPTPKDDESTGLEASPAEDEVCILNVNDKDVTTYFNSAGMFFGMRAEFIPKLSNYPSHQYLDVEISFYSDANKQWVSNGTLSVLIGKEGEAKVFTVNSQYNFNGASKEVVQYKLIVRQGKSTQLEYPVRLICLQKGSW